MKKQVVILCLIQFVDVLGVTEVLSAVPRMLASVSAAPTSASAVLTAYAMCFGGLLMAGARMGDRFGHRPVLVAGIALFAAGSLMAAIAVSAEMLIAGRAMQGAAAAISVPASLRLLIAATPRPGERAAAMSAWSAAGAVAGASGFVVGGVLTQLSGWRAMFWINLPLAALLAAAVLRGTGAQPRGDRRGLDVGGALLFSAGVAGLVLGAAMLEPPGRPALGLAAVVAGAVLLAALVPVERRSRDPLLPRATVRHPGLRTGALAAFFNTSTTSSAMAIATLELQHVQHLSPAAAGLRLLPVSLGGIAGAALAAPGLRRLTPSAAIAIGLGLIGLADAGLIAVRGAGVLLAVPVAAVGAGIGVSSAAANALGTEVGETLQSSAAGAINTAAQLGTALGVAALLLLDTASAHAALPLRGAALGWAVAAAAALAGATIIGPLPRALTSRRPAAVRDRRGRSPAARPDAPTPGG
jgi:MFS family permease